MFLWFGVAIVSAFLVAGVVASAFGPWRARETAIRRYALAQLAATWHDTAERDALLRDAAQAFDAGIVLSDADGTRLGAWGPACDRAMASFDVERGGQKLGQVAVCMQRGPRFTSLAVALGAVAIVMWGLSGRVARRLGRPLEDLAQVARDLGDGKLDRRVSPTTGEVAIVAQAVNEMADRIQRQLDDQRELLAAVSHEIRTPLARLRVLTELVRDGGATPRQLDGIEREIAEIDALVGELSASARLDFGSLERGRVDAVDLARSALERAGHDPGLLSAPDELAADLDPTLIARALANLLRNADEHGGGVVRMSVSREGERVVFAVEDAGRGFHPDVAEQAFEPFVRKGTGDRARATSLGLGLSLVRRIARAHGGDAWIARSSADGVTVCLSAALSAPDVTSA